MMVKTRFAPSPTGFLHVGGLRTALFAYLLAKKNKGKFILRIEDTDQKRFVPGGMENIISSLNWAGLKIDEGVKLDKNKQIIQVGENGPYIQSQRLDIYKKYVQQLLDQGDAYYCFCSKERLDNLRTEQEKQGLPTKYDGHCRNLTPEEVKTKIANGEKYVVRLKMPQIGETVINDLIRGEVRFKNELVDDQVILKSDGFPTYHLAVVVDDYLMGVTHVIRGEEWLPSTPKHVFLYQKLGWNLPNFVHLPLLVNENRKKLSKRHGDVSVKDYIEKGYLPEALINFIALLGWNPGDDREFFSLAELECEFDIKRISKNSAVFDFKKLNWYNQHYIRQKSLDELLNLVLPYLQQAGLEIEKYESTWLKKVIALEKNRVEKLSDFPAALKFIFELPDYNKELLIWKKADLNDAKDKLIKLIDFLNHFDNKEEEWTEKKIEEKIIIWLKENNFGVGNVLWPMRVALSGLDKSPNPFEIASVLGKAETLRRLQLAIDKIN